MSILTGVQYHLLKKISPGAPAVCDGSAYQNRSKLHVLLGEGLLKRLAGKTVIDFGCGEGKEALEIASAGATRVIGIDVRQEALEMARESARLSGLGEVCHFDCATNEKADVIVSIDAFEHFEDPAAVLQIMNGLLKPQGEVLVSFGPTWYHPLGGHVFSVFPWAHLLFSEQALIRWRASFKTDGATRFSEVAGGLNQMTIGRFEKLVARSPLKFASIELVPIRGLRLLHNRLSRELTTAIVRCCLVKRPSPTPARSS